MTLYDLKPRFKALLRPLTARLAAAKITANQVTLAAAIGSIAVGVFVAWFAENRIVFLLLPGWFLIRMALNAMDGMLAGEFGQKSKLGAYLNELCDVISDTALYLPFAFVAPFDWLGVGAVIVLAVISELAGILGHAVGASRHYDGPLGKSDRALVLGALALWIGVGGAMPDWLFWFMPALAALIALTIVNRVRAGLRESK